MDERDCSEKAARVDFSHEWREKQVVLHNQVVNEPLRVRSTTVRAWVECVRTGNCVSNESDTSPALGLLYLKLHFNVTGVLSVQVIVLFNHHAKSKWVVFKHQRRKRRMKNYAKMER